MKTSFLILLSLLAYAYPAFGAGENPGRHDHGTMASGTADCDRAGWVDRVSAQHQAVIDGTIATRAHRLQHALWHAVRSGLEQSQLAQVVSVFGPSWTQNTALCPSPGNNIRARNYNYSGEDFLFMHRQMIEMLNAAYIGQGLKCVRGWSSVPNPQQWPLPRGSRDGIKSAEGLARLQAWDRTLQDREWLRGVTLSQLGWAVEFTIHNNLHMRYAADRPPREFQGETADQDGAVIPYNGQFPRGWVFDSPRYNWLADPYGAAVNPIFWKIHGYVDRLIDLWATANGYDEVAASCRGRARCYQWHGTWTGSVQLSQTPPPDRRTFTPMDGGMHGCSASEAADESDLHRRRLEHQRLGVLTDEDLAPPSRGGPVRSGNPADPLEVARSKVCGE